MEYHEAANIFPLSEDTELDALAEDIRQHGLQIPVETLGGKIIDGRRRWLACLIAGVDPDVVEVDPDDPVAYVLSLNLHRRHLNESQRAMVGDAARDYYANQAKERQKEHGGTAPGKAKNNGGKIATSDTGKARDQAGAAVGVSGKLIDAARKVREQGSKPLQDAVRSGKLPVSSAAKIVTLPKSEQTRIAKSENPKAEASKARPDWAKGPTPAEQAEVSPERRWHATLHKLYVFMNSTRDIGGIKALVKAWSDKGRKEYVAELKRIIGELQKWVAILEK